MSRTDKQAHWHVKERDPAWAHYFTPDHDHRHGPCDLEQWLADPTFKGNCQMRLNGRRGNISCGRKGCPCSGADARPYHHRHARTVWRSAARDLRGYARSGKPRDMRTEPYRDPHREGAWGWWGRKQPGIPVTVYTPDGEVPYETWKKTQEETRAQEKEPDRVDLPRLGRGRHRGRVGWMVAARAHHPQLGIQ